MSNNHHPNVVLFMVRDDAPRCVKKDMTLQRFNACCRYFVCRFWWRHRLRRRHRRRRRRRLFI